MSYVIRAFRTPRPIWFRPSAIAVGWLLAQFWVDGIGGTCGDGTTRLFC